MDAATLYEEIGSKPMTARSWQLEGERAAAAGTDAEPAFRRAAELWREMGAPEFARRAEALLAESA